MWTDSPAGLLLPNMPSSGLNDVVRARVDPASTTIIGASAGNLDLFSAMGYQRRAPSFILGRQITGSFLARVASPSNFTYHTTTTVECAANRFRIALHNANAATSIVSLASIAVSNAIGADPVYGATTGQARFTPSTATWVPITFNSGSATVTLPAAIDATIDGGATTRRPSITWSDWIDISTIARIDGGTLPVVMFRIYIPSNGTTNAYTTGSYSALGTTFGQIANTAIHNGRLWNTIRYDGADGITVPTSFQPTTNIGFVSIGGFEYAAEKPGVTFCVHGDSIGDGAVNSSAGNYGNGWAWQAVTLLRALYPNTPIELLNNATASQYAAYFGPRVADILAAGSNFDVMMYSPFSPNDGVPTDVIVNGTQKKLLADVSNRLAAARKGLIISTPCPNTAAAWNSTADNIRKAFRTQIQSYKNWADILDFEVVSDGATPARFAAANTTDGTHPNEVGHGVIAVAAVPIMSKWVPR